MRFAYALAALGFFAVAGGLVAASFMAAVTGYRLAVLVVRGECR